MLASKFGSLQKSTEKKEEKSQIKKRLQEQSSSQKCCWDPAQHVGGYFIDCVSWAILNKTLLNAACILSSLG